jgi:hypothetical protein
MQCCQLRETLRKLGFAYNVYLNDVTVTETKTLCAKHAGHVCQYANGYAPYSNTYIFSRVVLMTFSNVGPYEFCLCYVFYDPWWYLLLQCPLHRTLTTPVTATVSEQAVTNLSCSGYTCPSTHCCPLSRVLRFSLVCIRGI